MKFEINNKGDVAVVIHAAVEELAVVKAGERTTIETDHLSVEVAEVGVLADPVPQSTLFTDTDSPAAGSEA